jgi:hypothetical protein
VPDHDIERTTLPVADPPRESPDVLDARLYVDGQEVGAGSIPATVPLIFSGDETTDLGRDAASPVSNDYSSEESVFKRHRRVGANRHRRGGRRQRSPDLAGGAPAHRHGPAVTRFGLS